MGDNERVGRPAGEDKGLVQHIHTQTGLISPNRPKQIVSVGNRISSAVYEDGVLVLSFLQGNANPVLRISDRSDMQYFFGAGKLTKGKELEELKDRPVYTHVDKSGIHGVSFGRMNADEAKEYDVLVD